MNIGKVAKKETARYGSAEREWLLWKSPRLAHNRLVEDPNTPIGAYVLPGPHPKNS